MRHPKVPSNSPQLGGNQQTQFSESPVEERATFEKPKSKYYEASQSPSNKALHARQRLEHLSGRNLGPAGFSSLNADSPNSSVTLDVAPERPRNCRAKLVATDSRKPKDKDVGEKEENAKTSENPPSLAERELPHRDLVRQDITRKLTSLSSNPKLDALVDDLELIQAFDTLKFFDGRDVSTGKPIDLAVELLEQAHLPEGVLCTFLTLIQSQYNKLQPKLNFEQQRFLKDLANAAAEILWVNLKSEFLNGMGSINEDLLLSQQDFTRLQNIYDVLPQIYEYRIRDAKSHREGTKSWGNEDEINQTITKKKKEAEERVLKFIQENTQDPKGGSKSWKTSITEVRENPLTREKQIIEKLDRKLLARITTFRLHNNYVSSFYYRLNLCFPFESKEIEKQLSRLASLELLSSVECKLAQEIINLHFSFDYNNKQNFEKLVQIIEKHPITSSQLETLYRIAQNAEKPNLVAAIFEACNRRVVTLSKVDGCVQSIYTFLLQEGAPYENITHLIDLPIMEIDEFLTRLPSEGTQEQRDKFFAAKEALRKHFAYQVNADEANSAMLELCARVGVGYKPPAGTISVSLKQVMGLRRLISSLSIKVEEASDFEKSPLHREIESIFHKLRRDHNLLRIIDNKQIINEFNTNNLKDCIEIFMQLPLGTRLNFLADVTTWADENTTDKLDDQQIDRLKAIHRIIAEITAEDLIATYVNSGFSEINGSEILNRSSNALHILEKALRAIMKIETANVEELNLIHSKVTMEIGRRAMNRPIFSTFAYLSPKELMRNLEKLAELRADKDILNSALAAKILVTHFAFEYDESLISSLARELEQHKISHSTLYTLWYQLDEIEKTCPADIDKSALSKIINGVKSFISEALANRTATIKKIDAFASAVDSATRQHGRPSEYLLPLIKIAADVEKIRSLIKTDAHDMDPVAKDKFEGAMAALRDHLSDPFKLEKLRSDYPSVCRWNNIGKKSFEDLILLITAQIKRQQKRSKEETPPVGREKEKEKEGQ